jgi:diadenosine tetraphosphate (Ap4A) HIT family hydrolase
LIFADNKKGKNMQVLWSNGMTNLILDKKGYLAIETESQKPLNELSREEIVDHEKTLGKIENLFQKLWGCGDFGRWMPLGKDRLTSFIFPARQDASKPDGVDFDQKVTFMLHTLSEDRSDSFKLTELGDMIAESAQEILSSSPPSISIEDRILPPLNVAGAVKKLGLDLTADSLSFVTVTALKLTKKCGVFCNPEIVRKQLVHQGKKVFVTCNNRPYTDCHLMILPNEHKEKPSQNTEEEIIEKYQLFHKISAFATGFEEQVAVMTRIGPRSGQTQPHLHDHVVSYGSKSDQLWKINWLNELTGQDVPPLSEEKMAEMKARWALCFLEPV